MNAYFHLCDCTCSNVMCVCSTICGSNKKYLCSFYLFLEVICIAHVFQSFSSFFVWKTYFLGVFVTYFMCKLSREFNWSNSQVFQLWIEIFASFLWVLHEYFVRRAYLRKFSATRENYQIIFLKGISWDICFKLFTSSSKPLF